MASAGPKKRRPTTYMLWDNIRKPQKHSGKARENLGKAWETTSESTEGNPGESCLMEMFGVLFGGAFVVWGRGPGTTQLTWTEGHVTTAQVEQGLYESRGKHGNDQADTYAKSGDSLIVPGFTNLLALLES